MAIFMASTGYHMEGEHETLDKLPMENYTIKTKWPSERG